jgi:hypothetical protein
MLFFAKPPPLLACFFACLPCIYRLRLVASSPPAFLASLAELHTEGSKARSKNACEASRDASEASLAFLASLALLRMASPPCLLRMQEAKQNTSDGLRPLAFVFLQRAPKACAAKPKQFSHKKQGKRSTPSAQRCEAKKHSPPARQASRRRSEAKMQACKAGDPMQILCSPAFIAEGVRSKMQGVFAPHAFGDKSKISKKQSKANAADTGFVIGLVS